MLASVAHKKRHVHCLVAFLSLLQCFVSHQLHQMIANETHKRLTLTVDHSKGVRYPFFRTTRQSKSFHSLLPLPIVHVEGRYAILLLCSSLEPVQTKLQIFVSFTPFRCGVPGAVFSKSMPNCCFLHPISSCLFSPAMSQRTVWILIPRFARSLNTSAPTSSKSLLFFRKRERTHPLHASTNRTQNDFPPLLGILIPATSTNSNSPGREYDLFTFLGADYCLALPIRQASHVSIFPVISQPKCLAVKRI
jgi:hypothetical protein